MIAPTTGNFYDWNGTDWDSTEKRQNIQTNGFRNFSNRFGLDLLKIIQGLPKNYEAILQNEQKARMYIQ